MLLSLLNAQPRRACNFNTDMPWITSYVRRQGMGGWKKGKEPVNIYTNFLSNWGTVLELHLPHSGSNQSPVWCSLSMRAWHLRLLPDTKVTKMDIVHDLQTHEVMRRRSGTLSSSVNSLMWGYCAAQAATFSTWDIDGALCVREASAPLSVVLPRPDGLFRLLSVVLLLFFCMA